MPFVFNVQIKDQKMESNKTDQKNDSLLKAGGRPNKGKSSPKMSVVMTEDMLEKIHVYAAENNITRGEVVRQCIKKTLG